MVNHNGTLYQSSHTIFSADNRAYIYGDALFETLKFVNGRILFWEDHYFRLMASMRILRIEIPMRFTMEFLESEVLRTLQANHLNKDVARVRLTIDRGNGGRYLPLKSSTVNYTIVAEAYSNPFYTLMDFENYLVDLYKDFYLPTGLLSGLKTTNKALQILGSIYAEENDYNNCLVLNTNKHVVEALNGNLFLVKGDAIKTPPLEDGCLRGVMRKQILNILQTNPNYVVEEASISPFELQKADELFITNTIIGIQSIGKYRKKVFTNKVAADIIKQLNISLRLS